MAGVQNSSLSLRDIAFQAIVHGLLSPSEGNRLESEWMEIAREAKDVRGNRLFSDQQIDQANISVGNVVKIVSWSEFTEQTLRLTQLIKANHRQLSGVIGCPRSGLRAAADVAIRLGIPLYTIAGDSQEVVRVGNGIRISGKNFEDGELVVVEDSSYSGDSISRWVGSHACYAVFATRKASRFLRGCAEIREDHYFDWHLFGCDDLKRDNRMGFDWDGVLNADCPVECDDDGERYSEWMRSVQPIRFTDWLPTVITARIERYRPLCLAWLDRWGIKVDNLVMFPGTFEQRRRTVVGNWKSKMIQLHGVGLFVESDQLQASQIAKNLGRMVLSTQAS